MRLIDADVFKTEYENLITWVSHRAEKARLREFIKDIQNQPTVKAIPIEWIEKKAQEFLMNRNFRWATDFQEVVDMWKVENNIPLFDGELKITWEKENEHKESD